MPVTSDAAVVLRRLEFSETSQVIVLFTRQHGKVRAIAKGIHRGTKTRFAIGVDLFDEGTVSFSVREERSERLAIVTEWSQTRVHAGLRERLDRLYAAQYAVEITAALTEDWDSHPGLFDALAGALAALDVAQNTLEHVSVYQRSLLEAIGSGPRFDACVACGRAKELTHFSSFDGGMVCRRCAPARAEKHAVSAATWRALAGLAEPESSAGPFGLLNYHISHLMGRQPALAAKLVARARRR